MNKCDESQIRNRARREPPITLKLERKTSENGKTAALADMFYAPSQRLAVSFFLNRIFSAYETYMQSPLYRRSLGSNTDDPPLRTSTASGPIMACIAVFTCGVMRLYNCRRTTYKFQPLSIFIYEKN